MLDGATVTTTSTELLAPEYRQHHNATQIRPEMATVFYESEYDDGVDAVHPYNISHNDKGHEVVQTTVSFQPKADRESEIASYVDGLDLDIFGDLYDQWSDDFTDFTSSFTWYVGGAYTALESFVYEPRAGIEFFFDLAADAAAELGFKEQFTYSLDAAAGFIDGTLDTLNPFDNYWSIPDLGPQYGHTTAYAVGNGVGMIAGIGAQLYFGNVSALGLCGTKLGTAIGLYNKAQFVGDMVSAVDSAMDLANGDGDWMDVANLALTAVSGVSASRGGCFPAGTPVLTYEGLKRIEHVLRGEAVWAFDLSDGQWKLRDVVETFEQDFAGELVTFTAAGETIQTTDHHPVYVIEGHDLANRPRREHIPTDPNATTPGRWVDAIDLRVGDVLLLKGKRAVPITRIEVETTALPVYNFEVDGLHCYAVGLKHVLVHNNACNIAESVAKGRAGELAAGIAGKKNAIPSITGTARNRFPDEVDVFAGTITEVKNVARQAFTSQIRDDLYHAFTEGLKLVLKVRQAGGTKLSGPLLRLHNAGLIEILEVL